MQTDRFPKTFSDPFEYDHYGEIYNRVDMRAEVGLMTRHILIDAEVSEGNSNGGHVKVRLFIYQITWKIFNDMIFSQLLIRDVYSVL